MAVRCKLSKSQAERPGSWASLFMWLASSQGWCFSAGWNFRAFLNVWIIFVYVYVVQAFNWCVTMGTMLLYRFSAFAAFFSNFPAKYFAVYHVEVGWRQYCETCLDRPLSQETTCLKGPLIRSRRFYILFHLNLSWKTTGLERPTIFLCLMGWCLKTGSTVLRFFLSRYPADQWSKPAEIIHGTSASEV